MTYAPLTISAVDHTAGTLTITAHGLITGGGFGAFPRGPLYGGAIYAPSGGVIPTGLAPVTTYWPIVIDANTIKLADSNAHAMAGTAVTFSTNGTLPLQFLVGLPYELPRVSAPGVQMFSDDDNTTWQSLKAIWALLTGQAQSIWSALVIAVAVTFSAAVTFLQDITLATNKNVVLQGTGNVKHGTWTKILVPNANANGTTFVTIDSSTIFGWCVMLDQHFQAGDVITAIRVNVTDNATGPTRASAKFRRYTDGSGSPADIAGPTATSGTAGTLQQIPFTGLSESIAAAKTHLLQVLPTGGSASITLWSVEIDWTR